MILPWIRQTERTYTVRLMLLLLLLLLHDERAEQSYELFHWRISLAEQNSSWHVEFVLFFCITDAPNDTSLGLSCIWQERRVKNSGTIYFYIKFHFICQQKLCWIPLNQFQLSHSFPIFYRLPFRIVHHNENLLLLLCIRTHWLCMCG